jgi:RNA polymerase sigma-70 factor (ECF subfamily)
VTAAERFAQARPRLLRLAYSELGDLGEAEDVVQEAWLRLERTGADRIEDLDAWLTTVVARLALDTLRSARVRREAYVGPWLPEPLVTDSGPGPDETAELADSVSLAFLVLLEELTPVERAVFLLREVFGYDYAAVAATVGKSEDNCRQLVVRARQRLAARRTRFEADSAHGRELTARFLSACMTGDLEGLLGMLADDVVLWSDGGGKVAAARRPVAGRDKVGRFLLGIAEKGAGDYEGRLVAVNGQPGAVFGRDGRVDYAFSLDVLDGQVVGVRIVANPDKLAHLRLQAS